VTLKKIVGGIMCIVPVTAVAVVTFPIWGSFLAIIVLVAAFLWLVYTGYDWMTS
jgi:hypothetical protein